MSLELWMNNARSSLAAAIAPDDTSFDVAAGQGARFPNPTGGDYFWVTIDNGSVNEICKVTTRATDSFSVVERGQQGTTARAWNIGTRIEQRITKSTLETFQAGSADVSNDLIWDAKGDLAVGTGANAAERLPVGANGYVLTADSGEDAGVAWAPGSSGILTGPYASLPAAGTAGRVYLPTDSFYTYLYDNGVSWDHFLCGRKVTPPVIGDFTAINQGGATITGTNGGQYILGPATAGISMRIWKKAAPTPPYTIEIAMMPVFGRAGNPLVGACFRKSGAEAQLNHRFGAYQANASFMHVQSAKMTSATVHSANYFDVIHGSMALNPLWIQISDDNTNRIGRMSRDGKNWIQLESQTRTDHLTADEVGVFVESGDTTYPVGATWLHWEES